MRNRVDYNSGGSEFSSSDEDSGIRKVHDRMCGVGNQKSNDIVPRPNASPGYWLCCLLPLALCTTFWTTLKDPERCSEMPDHFKLITLTSMAICIQNISFFIYLTLQAKLYKWLIVFVPFVGGACIYKYGLGMTWLLSSLWTVFIDVIFQRCYIQVMRDLPKSFTYGEASILTQGVVLFLMNTLIMGYRLIIDQPSNEELGDLRTLSTIMTFALLWLLIVCTSLLAFQFLRKPFIFYPIMITFVAAATLAPVTTPIPVIAVFEFIFRDKMRLYIILFYVALVGATIIVVCWQLRNSQHATTSVRKLFHLLVVLVYIPGFLYECVFLYIASGVALALIAIFDLLRILKMPPLGEILEKAFFSFADEKDAGLIAFTPMCLLIGSSLPMWIMPCPCVTDEHGLNSQLLALLAGILTIGFGDTAASVIGSKWGRTKWRNSSRSIEGSVAFVIYVILPIVILQLMEFIQLNEMQWGVIVLATLVAALVEAHTDQIDNLVLPLVFYVIVSLGC
ncbi:dolichol kinase isoform X1 [Stomoxys calcitrans]|uniref:dolichol kinase isoform X1 n=2 Tax=Stomoxys calcitrans TaxID=35570 RepID=UPI0027E28AD2|nr:dolichol kinase isoform X1 [Stomoxys calcitrans]